MSSDQNGGSGGPNRTVFRPSPLQGAKQGGEAPPQQPQGGAPQAAAPVRPKPTDDVPMAPAGKAPRNLMMAEATAFLALISSVRAGRAAIDLPGLHGKVVDAITRFEQGVAGRYTDEEIRRAKYALATTADDVALNLPNQQADGAEWARRAIVVRFFGENIGGDRFWKLLDEMVASPAQYRDLLELYHACMAAGFEGRYRVMADGKREHLGQMQRVYIALEHPRTLSMTELSPQWKGEPTPAAKVGLWGPVALAAAIAATLLTVIFIILRIILAQTGGPASTALAHLNPDQPLRLSRTAPAPPAPPQDQQLMRLRQFLAPEIAQGLVTVIDDASTVRVRTTVGQLFKSGSDQLDGNRAGLFQRIGQGINGEPGPVRVEGYSDSDRVNSISFPDNMALSKARADTVAAIVKGAMTDPSRVTVEGYGDAQPIASNSTAAGKSQNRRVEIVIQRKG
ncbi:MAG TPA: type IVB secretion system protein IcmH/DotU [Caulobacteraceae bacterium]